MQKRWIALIGAVVVAGAVAVLTDKGSGREYDITVTGASPSATCIITYTDVATGKVTNAGVTLVSLPFHIEIHHALNTFVYCHKNSGPPGPLEVVIRSGERTRSAQTLDDYPKGLVVLNLDMNGYED